MCRESESIKYKLVGTFEQSTWLQNWHLSRCSLEVKVQQPNCWSKKMDTHFMNGWCAIQEIVKYNLIVSRGGGVIWSPLFGGAQGAWRVGVFSSAAWAALVHKHAHVQSPCAPPSNHPPTPKKKQKTPKTATNVSYIKYKLILTGIGTGGHRKETRVQFAALHGDSLTACAERCIAETVWRT